MIDVPPMVKWTAAVIAGGGIAGITQGVTATLRANSTIWTGGLGNLALSAAEPCRMVSAAFFGVAASRIGWHGGRMNWARILAYVTGTVDQELLLRNEYLAAENRILKARLKGRVRFSDAERARLGEIGHRLGRKVVLLKIRNPNNSCAKFPNSLFFAEKFPVHCKKFPVPLRREFCRKVLNLLPDWARKSAREVGFLQNSLFFSLLAQPASTGVAGS